VLSAVRRLLISGLVAFSALSMVFWFYCTIGGHNPVEALYGGVATYFLSFVAAIEFAWLEA
jgi:hypothetical protein